MTKLLDRSLYFLGFSLTYSRYKLSEADMTLGSRSHRPFFILSLYSAIEIPVSCFIFWRTRRAFFLTRSVVWPSSFTTCSVIDSAIVEFMILPREVKQMTISCTSPLVKSLSIVATSIMSRSEFLSKKSEHIRYPILFSTKFLFCVKLMAWICANEAECPNISM